jgi:hypothetical protein
LAALAGKVLWLMSIKFVDPNVLALLGALMAIDLAQSLDLEEQNVAGNFIIDVGQILLTMAAAEEAQKKAADEQADKIKKIEEEEKEKKEQGKEKKEQGMEVKKEDTQTKPADSDQSDEDEFIGRDRKALELRIDRLEQQVRQLVEILARKS